jgi:hypothetical protein
MLGHWVVHAQYVNVVAQHLKVVGGVITREQSFVVQHRTAGIGGHLQVAAKTGRRPGGMACVAGHAAVAMGQMRVVFGHLRIDRAIFIDQLGAQGFFVEVHIAGSHAVGGLHDFPFFMLIRHGALNERLAAPFETTLSPRSPQGIEMAATLWNLGTVDR